jgi:hypothetical protein
MDKSRLRAGDAECNPKDDDPHERDIYRFGCERCLSMDYLIEETNQMAVPSFTLLYQNFRVLQAFCR